MSVRPFLDTNVLLYAVGPVDRRRSIARSLVDAGGVISVQVLNEFVHVARRKLGRDWDEITHAVGDLRSVLEPPLPLTVELHAAALTLARHNSLSFYDSLIVAAALEAQCDVLYTEDMQDGRRFGDLVIRNPFAAD